MLLCAPDLMMVVDLNLIIDSSIREYIARGLVVEDDSSVFFIIIVAVVAVLTVVVVAYHHHHTTTPRQQMHMGTNFRISHPHHLLLQGMGYLTIYHSNILVGY